LNRLTCGCEDDPHYHTNDGQCSLGIDCDPADVAEHLRALAGLRALPFREKIDILRNYVVAKTAQDCSIMLALQRLGAGDGGNSSPDGERHLVQDPVTGLFYRYQVTL